MPRVCKVFKVHRVSKVFRVFKVSKVRRFLVLVSMYMKSAFMIMTKYFPASTMLS